MNRLRRLGVATIVVLLVFAAPASAQEVWTIEQLASATMVIYLMVATALVFIMHAGFAMLEAGLTRQKNTANIIGKNLMTISVGIVVYYAIGWGVMYGRQIGGLIGTDSFFLVGGSYVPDATLGMDFAFQAMFAATASTIVSGAVAERMRFSSYVVVAAVMTGLIYPVVGAWTWGGGWIAQLGFHDFAGSTIVHLTGGVAALVGAAVLGPRLGRFDPKTGAARPMAGQSIAFTALGTLLLFFGWFGFNGGSVLALDGELIGVVLVNTALAGGAGGLTAGVATWMRRGSWDVAMMANGILAGLVGITAGADAIAFPLALAVGALAGTLVVVSVATLDRCRIDDPVGAVSVHGACGILGTIWVALFATEGGLLLGGGVQLLVAALVAILGVVVWVGAGAGVVFGTLKALGKLRVAEAEEREGLDVHEHGVVVQPVELATR